MASRFLSTRDQGLFTSINRELVGDPKSGAQNGDGIINQTAVLYRISVADTTTNLYGEAAGGKTYLAGVKVPCMISADDIDFNTDEFGLDAQQTAQFWVEREYLTELNLVIEPGDIFDWNYAHFEIGSINENQLVGGNVDSNWSVVCNTFLVRRSNLQIERIRQGVN
jgi:hypothetical protein